MKITKSSSKDISVVEGYEVGKLTIVIQGVKAKDNTIVKGVFCTLDIKKPEEEKPQVLNFVFSLNSVPGFQKHIVSMINEAIKLHVKPKKVVKKKDATIKKQSK